MGKREHTYEIIAENIRKERRRLGITQAELAERADVSLDTIKSVENVKVPLKPKFTQPFPVEWKQWLSWMCWG